MLHSTILSVSDRDAGGSGPPPPHTHTHIHFVFIAFCRPEIDAGRLTNDVTKSLDLQRATQEFQSLDRGFGSCDINKVLFDMKV